MSQTSIIFAAIVVAYVVFTVVNNNVVCWLEILGFTKGSCCSQLTSNTTSNTGGKIILQPAGGGVPPAPGGVGVTIGPGGTTIGGTVSGPGGTVRVPGVTIPNFNG